LKYTCIETFCGAGGLASGLQKAGFEILWAFDSNESAIETFKHNITTSASVEDATVLTAEDVLNRTNLKKGELTLLSGGPPCQGFSRQKRNGENGDKRNRLIVKYIRLVQGIAPKFFLMENVDTFKKKRGKAYMELLIKGLDKDYTISIKEVNCANYGVPQTRKRTIVLGIRKDIVCDYKFPKESHKASEWITVGQALKGIPEPDANGKEHSMLANHTVPKITKINIERISYVPQGSGRKCLPKHLQLPCHKKKTGWPDVYGRMAINKPAPTITGGFDNFTRGRFAHPLRNRPITSREAATLQTFDYNFEFKGNKGAVRQQIGNAVPPLIGEKFGLSIIHALEEGKERINWLDLEQELVR